MTSKNEAWARWERDVQDQLGLDSTPGSGNQWHSPSDGVSPGHWSESTWPLMVDCKQTVQQSYSVTRKMLDQWVRTAAESGRRFLLPIRFEKPGEKAADYVVVPFSDYVEMHDRFLDLMHCPPTPYDRLDAADVEFLQRLHDVIEAPGVKVRLQSIIAKVRGS